MRSQFVTASETSPAMRSQIATAYKRNIRFLPYAFTENGAIMAANVLNREVGTPNRHFKLTRDRIDGQRPIRGDTVQA